MQTEKCRSARERLLKYLEDPTSRAEALDLALWCHAQCPDCRQRFRQLLEDLLRNVDADTASCPYEAWIPGYAAMEILAQADEPPWPEIAEHLATCNRCAALYAEIKALQGYAEQGAIPAHYPEPDLGFLRAEPQESTPWPPFWHVDTLGRLIVEFSNELLRRLPMLLYRPAAAGLKSGASSQVLFEVALAESRDDLDVTITAERPQSGETGFCTLIVEVKIPSRGGWPNLAGTQVRLKRGQETLVTRLTDAFGKAVFPHIPLRDLPEISVEITPVEDSEPPSA